MNRNRSVLATFVLASLVVLGLAPGSASFAQTNLIINGGFESNPGAGQAPTGWTKDFNSYGAWAGNGGTMVPSRGRSSSVAPARPPWRSAAINSPPGPPHWRFPMQRSQTFLPKLESPASRATLLGMPRRVHSPPLARPRGSACTMSPSPRSRVPSTWMTWASTPPTTG